MNRNPDQQALPALSAADCISIAAAPTFAVMALLSGTLGDELPDMLCSAVHGTSPLSGMVLMYLLISASIPRLGTAGSLCCDLGLGPQPVIEVRPCGRPSRSQIE